MSWIEDWLLHSVKMANDWKILRHFLTVCTVNGFKRADNIRVRESNRKSSDNIIQRYKKLRAQHKGFEDKDAEKDGVTYVYGGF